jgi:hypothetical protein
LLANIDIVGLKARFVFRALLHAKKKDPAILHDKKHDFIAE